MPKKLMYTERVKDVLNCAVSDLMAQNGFDEILRYLHLAGNSNLNENEKLAKVFDHSTICWILCLFKLFNLMNNFVLTNLYYLTMGDIRLNSTSKESPSRLVIRFVVWTHLMGTWLNVTLMLKMAIKTQNLDLEDQQWVDLFLN